MASALSYPSSAGVFLYDQFTGSGLRNNTTAPSPRSLNIFDDRFDAFWEALRRNKHNVLLAVRSREVLQWHFKAALDQNAAWIYAIESNSGMGAYAVFLSDDYPELGLTRVRLADFQCLDQDQA